MTRSGAAALTVLALAAPGAASAGQCPETVAGITVPEGFCVIVVADDLGRARHLAVADNGDLFVAVPQGRERGILALRDTDGDGVAEVRRVAVADTAAFYVRLWTQGDASWLYYGTHNEVIRYRRPLGRLAVEGAPDTVVRGLPGVRQHGIKTFAIGSDGRLFVNVGAPSNACQLNDRQRESPGRDPCPLLDSTGGIWLFDANRSGQTPREGRRYATGLRNAVALTVHPATGVLYGVIHGRDMLGALWGFSDSANAEKPAEQMVRIDEGDDFGWPYCYYDAEHGQKVLAPEYGGDGTTVGRCAEAEDPLVAFPAHWAPDGIAFYDAADAAAFPQEYRGGAFIAFHGSWNRAPLPQAGYNIVFVPLGGSPSDTWRVFADGFREHGTRPVGVVVGPEGSLFVSGDPAGRGGTGRIYRIRYEGAR